MKGFALGLALKQRRKATQEWGYSVYTNLYYCTICFSCFNEGLTPEMSAK